MLSRKLIFQKSGSSNLLEEITNSMVAFRIDLFVLTSRDASPRRTICVKLKSQWSKNYVYIVNSAQEGASFILK